MLAAIASALGGQIIDSLLGKIMGTLQAYFNKQISIEELRAKMVIALTETFAEVEKAHADALAKTYASFMDAMKTSKLMQIMWAWTVGTQLFILVWSQFFVPLLFAYSILPSWKAGTTGDWAYLLLGSCLGMGPLVLRSGPGALSVDKLKALISK
jgi:hypothetical protein